MEEKSLLNKEALYDMKHANKNPFVHHINTEDEIVLEFLGEFNFSNPIECTEVEIDEFLENNSIRTSFRPPSFLKEHLHALPHFLKLVIYLLRSKTL